MVDLKDLRARLTIGTLPRKDQEAMLQALETAVPALEFYADRDLWKHSIPHTPGQSPGRRAREALALIRKEQP